MKVEDEETGTKRDARIRVLGRDTGNDAQRRDRELLTKEPGKGNITYLIEFEDCLWDSLIEVLHGKPVIGISDGKLEGYDIQEHVKLYLKGEPRPKRPKDFRGEIAAQKKAEREAKAAAQKATELADEKAKKIQNDQD